MTDITGTESLESLTRPLDGARDWFIAAYRLLLDDARLVLAERGEHTGRAAQLVHQAYLRLTLQGGDGFHDCDHFRRQVVALMRWIPHEPARVTRAETRELLLRVLLKRLLHEQPVGHDEAGVELLEALEELDERHPHQAEWVRLRYLAGLSLAEACALLGITAADATRYWNYARAWLFDRLGRDAYPETI